MTESREGTSRMLGTISESVLHRQADGRPQPVITAEGEADPEQLSQITEDLTTVNRMTTGSPFASLKTDIEELSHALLESTGADKLMARNVDELGLKNLLNSIVDGAVGIGASKIEACVVELNRVLNSLETCEFLDREGASTDRVTSRIAYPGESRVLLVENVLSETLRVCNDTWLSTLYAQRKELRAAIVRLREVAARLPDGLPIILSIDHAKPRLEQLSWQQIDLANTTMLIGHLRIAEALAAERSSSVAGTHLDDPAEPSSPGNLPDESTVKDNLSGPDAEAESGPHAEGDDPHVAGPQFTDDLFVDLTLLSNGLLDSTVATQRRWSEALGQALEQDPSYIPHVQSMFTMLTRVLDEWGAKTDGGAVVTFPVPVPQLLDILGRSGSNDPNGVAVQRASATVTVFQDVLNGLNALVSAVLQNRHEPNMRFWHDGAFATLLLGLDMLNQVLREQVAADLHLTEVFERANLQLTLNFEDDVFESLAEGAPAQGSSQAHASFTFTVAPAPILEFLLSLASQSRVRGDYVASIFHTCNAARRVIGEEGSIERALLARGSSSEDATQLGALYKLFEHFIAEPNFSPSRVILLAAGADHLVERLKQPRVPEMPTGS